MLYIYLYLCNIYIYMIYLIYLTYCLSFFSVITTFDATCCIFLLKCFNCFNSLSPFPFCSFIKLEHSITYCGNHEAMNTIK